jgi:RNA polymerase sigma-70 factor (ECF subfamily)
VADGWGDLERARRADADETRVALDWLTAAMRQLPVDLRETVALVLDDLTHAEAAGVLGISEGTVSWRLSEARKRLREMKEEDA